MGKHYVGEIGTSIILDCGISIANATKSNIKYKKPDGTEGSFTGAVYLTNFVKYSTQSAADLDQSGTWTFQADIASPTWTGLGEAVDVYIYPAYKAVSDFTFDVTTNLGKVRVLIGDMDAAEKVLGDTAINTLLTLQSNDIYTAAAHCLLAIAASKSLLAKKVTAGNYSEDASMVAKELRETAQKYLDIANSVPAEAQAEVFLTDFNYRDILLNQDLRGEVI
jgi:hypothetical protein